MNQHDIVFPQRHQSVRIRHEARRRKLRLASIERLTPWMLRLGFRSPDLYDFVSLAHDDHIKLFFPDGAGGTAMRDFTPRRFDIVRGALTIDFALHESGPATLWAASAKVGDTLEIGGPRGSNVVQDDFDWYLLIGDETALPAILRRVEELREGVPVATFIVSGQGGAQNVPTRAAWTPHWIERDRDADDATLLRAALAEFRLPPGDGFVWIAAEAAVARSIRGYIVDERRHPKRWLKASGYWRRGEPDCHETIAD